MPKYNTRPRRSTDALYRSQISPQLMDELMEKIREVILFRKKYRDKTYSARSLAADLGTNTRYISAVVNVRFHTNYTSFVNKYRVEEAMSLLTDKRYMGLGMEAIAERVGFANRQSFYAAFYRVAGTTPRQYRMGYLLRQPAPAAAGERATRERK